MDTQSIPQVRDSVRIRRFRGRLMVVDIEDALELTKSAEFIFRKIDGTRTVEEISALLAEEYGIPLLAARHDTMELLADLSDNRITTLGSRENIQ